MNNATTEFTKWKDLFEQLDYCYLKKDPKHNDDRLTIASFDDVPWANALKPERNEAPNKIGYLFQQKYGVRLDIDFPVDTYTKEYIQKIIDPYDRIHYFDQNENASPSKSWWRFKLSDNFDTLIMVVRNEELGSINLEEPGFVSFFQGIVNMAY